MRLSLPLFCVAILAGCAATPPVTTFYDYQLTTPRGKAISVERFVEDTANADVILVGEWHTHAGIHRFQTDLLRQLSAQKRPVALSMEQFSRADQKQLDEYLQGKIGEQYLIQSAATWPNYESDYRPLIELAKARQIAVIAANAPRHIVRCIGRHGLDYLDRLTIDQRHLVAADIHTQDSAYKQQFMASMHHGTPEQTENQYAAQVTWDDTMAESIVGYLAQHPGQKVMHMAGLFHTQSGLGTAAAILRRDPSLRVVIITPVSEWPNGNNDYQLRVVSPPVRYIQPEHQALAFQTLAHRNSTLTCQPSADNPSAE